MNDAIFFSILLIVQKDFSFNAIRKNDIFENITKDKLV